MDRNNTIKVFLLAKISPNTKHTRWLIKYKSEFASIKLETNDFYYPGIEVDVLEKDINDIPFREYWKQNLNNWAYKIREILKHLSKYKIENITTASGCWKQKYYDHILPDDKENIIDAVCEYKASIEELYEKNKKNIHFGFNHLNSSQAFAFNFFQPIIEENLFNKLLADSHISIDSTNFETDYEKNNPDETQFDFYLSAGAIKCSFEVKYTEERFGFVKLDKKDRKKYDDYDDKWNEIYEPKLKSILKENIGEDEFFDGYQLWRNIIFAKDDSHITYFVFPKFRGDLAKKVEDARNKCNDDVQNRIKILYVDDFVDEMRKSDNENLRNHYTEFYKKYLDIPKI